MRSFIIQKHMHAVAKKIREPGWKMLPTNEARRFYIVGTFGFHVLGLLLYS